MTMAAASSFDCVLVQ